MKNYRIALLIKLLSKQEQPLSSREICEQLKISPRTLRDDITRYKADLLQHGVELVAKHGVGYSLTIIDQDKYYALIKSLLKIEQQRYFVLPQQTAEREHYLIRTFLAADDYLKLDDIADELYISRSTLNNYLKNVREALQQFNLELVSKPAYGVKIHGSEADLRRAIARYFFYDDTYQHLLYGNQSENQTRQQLRDILIDVLSQHKLKLTDLGFQNLIIHLEIALLRIAKNHYHEQLSDDYQVLQQRTEFAVAQQLAQQIAEVFQLTFPEPEIYFITIHLMGKRSFNHDNTFVITPEIEALFKQIFAQIDAVFQINLLDDFELYTLLALHFRPMLDRLAYKLNISNPLLEQIKEENVQAFEMAVLAGQVIHQQTGLEVNEAEIGYMAAHFALAIERKQHQSKKYKIIVVCASGTGSSQLLLYRIKQRFGHCLQEITVVPLYELKQFAQHDYDFILSTVDIPFKTAIQVLRVHYMLDAQDVAQMAHYLSASADKASTVDHYFAADLFFTDLRSSTRETLIVELCQRIAATITLPAEFTQLVLQREKLAATEFGNQIAFPHPLRHLGDKTFVAVAVLPKAIKWDKQLVRYIFLLNVRQDEPNSLQLLHETLLNLMNDSQQLKQLEQAPDFSTFISLLQQSAEQAQAESNRDTFK